MLLMSPIVPHLSECAFEGLVLTNECIFGLLCHSHRSAVNRIPRFNCLCEAQDFIMQTPISGGYY